MIFSLPYFKILGSVCLASRTGRCFQLRSFGNGSRFQVTPQIDDQPSGQGHDTNPPHACASSGKPFVVPLAQFAVGLQPEPRPGDLDEQFSDSPVSGPADSLFSHTIAAVVGRRCQAHGCGQFPPVTKCRHPNSSITKTQLEPSPIAVNCCSRRTLSRPTLLSAAFCCSTCFAFSSRICACTSCSR